MLIIVDLDGTLVKSQEAYLSSFIKGIQRVHGHVNKEMIEKAKTMFGLTAREVIQTIVPEANDITVKIILASARNYMSGIMDEIVAFEETIPFLKHYSKTHKIVVATSSGRSYTDQILKQTKIDKYVDKSYTSEDVSKHKPDPEILYKIMEDYKVDEDDTVYIGDSIYDYKAARTAGIRFIAVLKNSFSTQELLNTSCETVNNLSEIKI
jgi:HAD superfamily hydrolase (TIGR01549 family)